jgi:hypothetical protein
MSALMRPASARMLLRPITVRGKARFAVSKPSSLARTLAGRTFSTTGLLRNASEGTFEDIKVKPYVNVEGQNIAHFGE